MNAGTGVSGTVAKVATPANRIDETQTTARAVVRSRFVAGKVDRKMLRSSPVGTHDLLQAGIEGPERVQSNVHTIKHPPGREIQPITDIDREKCCRASAQA